MKRHVCEMSNPFVGPVEASCMCGWREQCANWGAASDAIVRHQTATIDDQATP